MYSVQYHLKHAAACPGPSCSTAASLLDAGSRAGSLGVRPSPLFGSGGVIFVPEDARIV